MDTAALCDLSYSPSLRLQMVVDLGEPHNPYLLVMLMVFLIHQLGNVNAVHKHTLYI